MLILNTSSRVHDISHRVEYHQLLLIDIVNVDDKQQASKDTALWQNLKVDY